MSIRDEIDDARRRLGLSGAQLAEVPGAEAGVLTAGILSRFTGGVDSRWWWEHFSCPTAAHTFEDGRGFARIWAIVPDPQERVWFVVEGGELPYFPVYETTPAVAQQVIGECHAFEYYLVAKDLRWLLCENHHGVVVAAGAAIAGLVRSSR